MDAAALAREALNRYRSYRAAAAATGVPYATLWRMENGTGTPEDDNVRRLERALGKGETVNRVESDLLTNTTCENVELKAEVVRLRAALVAAEEARDKYKSSAAMYYHRIGELEAMHKAEVARLNTWTSERAYQMEQAAIKHIELEARVAAAEQRAERAEKILETLRHDTRASDAVIDVEEFYAALRGGEAQP